jgi:hypothetical protein
MDWEALEPSGTFDGAMRLVVTLTLLGWNVFEGLSLRTPYPAILVDMWHTPLWRAVFLLLVWLGAEWCPRVGVMTALAVILYIVNMLIVS